jgi:membrane protein DedA with SNARE-associated domain
LIAAAVLASQGHGSIVWTIVLAIVAAILGAGISYAIGRRFGRGLLRRWRWFERVTKSAVERSDDFFQRHGAKAVVIGRFIPVLRATLGWMAGVGRMQLPRFLLANVAGAVAWGLAIGLVAYYVGGAVIRYGTYALGGAAALFLAVAVVWHRVGNRL